MLEMREMRIEFVLMDLILVLLLLLVLVSPTCAGKASPIGVMILGDKIPDQAFLHYDPALQYTVIPFPSFAALPGEDEAESMARSVRMHLPRSREGKYWEVFDQRWQFVIVLPYLTEFGMMQDSPYDSPFRQAWLHLTKYVSNSVIRGSVSVLNWPDPVSPVGMMFPYSGAMERSCPDCPPGYLEQFDLLRGKPSKSFRLNVENSSIFEEFKGTGIEEYHDASLALIGRPVSAAQIPISVDLWGGARTVLEEVVKRDPLVLREGKIPWLVYSKISKIHGENSEMGEILADAGGIGWVCASPLNGPFFFPRGGYVASSPNYNPRSPPTMSRVSIGEDHPYAWDIVSTMVYYSCGRDLPELLQAHGIRMSFTEYWRRRTDILHVLDWVERWREGPVVGLLWRDLAQVEGKKARATALYIHGEYKKSGETIRHALEGIAKAEEDAQISLVAALSWIYLIEGCLVGAVALIAGSTTFYFMGAKRVKVVGETRLRLRSRSKGRGHKDL